MRKTPSTTLTFAEWTLAIFIFVILAVAIFVAVDPVRHRHEARNAQRAVDIAIIMNAVKQSQSDSGSLFDQRIAILSLGSPYQIGTPDFGCSIPCGSQKSNERCLSLGEISPRYLSAVPIDPSIGTPEATGYAFSKNTPDSLTIIACHSEGEGMLGLGKPPQIQIMR